MSQGSFFRELIKSIGYAARGARWLLATERSIRIQAVIGILVCGAGFYFRISATEWMIQLLAIGMVMGVEGVNTAIEKLSDYIQPDFDERIGRIKDLSAGAVMFTSIMASIVGLIIYLPKMI